MYLIDKVPILKPVIRFNCSVTAVDYPAKICMDFSLFTYSPDSLVKKNSSVLLIVVKDTTSALDKINKPSKKIK